MKKRQTVADTSARSKANYTSSALILHAIQQAALPCIGSALLFVLVAALAMGNTK